MKRKLPLIFLLFLLPFLAIGQQIPIGTWRSHLNYSDTRLVAISESRVYASSASGLYYFDREDNSLNKLTRNDGFGDVGISALTLMPENKGLLIGYGSGLIDILDADYNLYTLDAIKTAEFSGSKAINDISFYGDYAYLSTNFGLVALDIVKKEVKEIYNKIGIAGTSLKINSSAVFNDSIFLASSEGIIASSLDPRNNLLDFNNWRRFGEKDSIPGSPFKAVATFNSFVYAGAEEDSLFRYDGFEWIKTNIPTGALKRLKSIDAYLYLIDSSGIIKISENNVFETVADGITISPADIASEENGKLWIADRKLGLLAVENTSFENFYPEGPFSDHIDELTIVDEGIAGIESISPEAGGSQNFPPQFALFSEGTWKNYSEKDFSALETAHGFTDIAFSEGSATLYLSDYGNGIYTWDLSDDGFDNFDAEAGENTLVSGQVAGMAFDDNGPLWILEDSTPDILHRFNEGDRSWERQNLNTSVQALSVHPLFFGMIWIKLASGILALDIENDASQLLTSNNEQLIANEVTDLVVDKDGLLWYGTEKGLAYFLNPPSVFEGNVGSTIPEFEGADLFKDRKVTAIGVDGGNRKWFATEDGLYLFDQNIENEIFHFTVENSPLLSHNIFDLAINETTGEVFIATDKGLVSFRSDATAGNFEHQQVKIFPNPVKAGFNGEIAISGLVQDAIVKITDLSGNLVREVIANGGTATWNGNNLSGRKVNTGVYLIFSSSEDGKENFIGKVAFIK